MVEEMLNIVTELVAMAMIDVQNEHPTFLFSEVIEFLLVELDEHPETWNEGEHNRAIFIAAVRADLKRRLQDEDYSDVGN